MRRDDDGAATVLVVTFSGLLLAVGCALAAVGGLLGAHRTAQAAADLAALAGAQAVGLGRDGCAAAASTAAANGASIDSCVVLERDVRVTVRVSSPSWLGRRAELLAEARAGPA